MAFRRKGTSYRKKTGELSNQDFDVSTTFLALAAIRNGTFVTNNTIRKTKESHSSAVHKLSRIESNDSLEGKRKFDEVCEKGEYLRGRGTWITTLERVR